MNPIRFNWKSRCYPALAILTGLLTAQIIATFQVYFSNRSLYLTLETIRLGGYLTVPNEATMGSLQQISTAMCGGLFLTLSLGAGISLLAFAAAWLWDRVFSRKTVFLVLPLLLWAGLMGGFNQCGFSLFGSLFAFAVPPLVFAGALKWMPRGDRKRFLKNGFLQAVPLVALGLLCAPQMKKDLFYHIRDRLLLTNPVGESIVDFYYQYTLYAAEALKSLDQKLLKTVHVGGSVKKNRHGKELREILRGHDWFETENAENAHLIITGSGNLFILEGKTGTVLKVPTTEFFSRPAETLKRFSYRVDRKRFLRQFTFYSLLVGFPVTLYILLYSLFFFIMGKWLPSRKVAILSAALCFLTGVLMLLPLMKR